MSPGPLLETAIQTGLAALEAQTAALGQTHAARLKPGQRRDVRAAIDNLARRLVAWQELAGPELGARLAALAESVRALRIGRRECARGRGCGAGARRQRRKEAR